MAFTPPDLITDLDPTNYRSQLKQNFQSIEDAFNALLAYLPASIAAAQADSITRIEALLAQQGLSPNPSWVENALRGDGLVGVLSFVPSWTSSAFSISHASNPLLASSCVLSGRYHSTAAAFSKNFSALGLSSGLTTCVFGVTSAGAPLLTMDLVKKTSASFNLNVYELDIYLSGGVYTVVELRLVADVIMDRDAFKKTFAFEHGLSMAWDGIVRTTAGRIGTGVVVPWACSIEGGYARLERAPDLTDGVEIQFLSGEGTDAENVFAMTAGWFNGDEGKIVTLTPLSTRKQIPAGGLIYPYVTVPDLAGVASDLSATFLVKRLYHAIV